MGLKDGDSKDRRCGSCLSYTQGRVRPMADCLAAHAEASAHVRLTGMLAPSPAVELAAAVNACVALADVPHHPPSDAVQRAACISRRLMQALAAGESAGWSLDELRDAVAPARAVHA